MLDAVVIVSRRKRRISSARVSLMTPAWNIFVKNRMFSVAMLGIRAQFCERRFVFLSDMVEFILFSSAYVNRRSSRSTQFKIRFSRFGIYIIHIDFLHETCTSIYGLFREICVLENLGLCGIFYVPDDFIRPSGFKTQFFTEYEVAEILVEPLQGALHGFELFGQSRFYIVGQRFESITPSLFFPVRVIFELFAKLGCSALFAFECSAGIRFPNAGLLNCANSFLLRNSRHFGGLRSREFFRKLLFRHFEGGQRDFARDFGCKCFQHRSDSLLSAEKTRKNHIFRNFCRYFIQQPSNDAFLQYLRQIRAARRKRR